MVVGSELLAVVTPTNQSSSAAAVTVIDSSISGSITVSLALTTGLLGSTAPPPVVVTAPASLTRGRSQGSSGQDDWRRGLGKVLRTVTAVVLLVVISSELLAVVTPTHEVSLAASVSVMASSVSGSITVSLS